MSSRYMAVHCQIPINLYPSSFPKHSSSIITIRIHNQKQFSQLCPTVRQNPALLSFFSPDDVLMGSPEKLYLPLEKESKKDRKATSQLWFYTYILQLMYSHPPVYNSFTEIMGVCFDTEQVKYNKEKSGISLSWLIYSKWGISQFLSF